MEQLIHTTSTGAQPMGETAEVIQEISESTQEISQGGKEILKAMSILNEISSAVKLETLWNLWKICPGS